MKTTFRIAAVAAVCVVLALTSGVNALAPLGPEFTYQGRLTSAGSPADGLHDLRFRLFDAATGGSQVGGTLCADNVDVVDGLFTVVLDFDQQFATPEERHLEIQVRRDSGLNCNNSAGFSILAPRQQLTATPLASHAKSAFALDAADGSPADAVFVNNAGNVGIGTLSPGHRLDVGAGFLGDGIGLRGAGSNDPGYHLYDGSNSRATLGLALHAGIWSTDAAPGDIVLRSSTGKLLLQNGALSSALAINGNNVGIGTAAPAAKLDVRGDIRLGPTGQLRATSGEENLRIIRGVVAANGSIITGSGFTVRHDSAGNYLITFNTPFAGPPSVTGTVEWDPGASPTGNVGIVTDGVTSANARLLTREHNINDWRDMPFHFIAIGPR
jgi:hypothetical protein